MKKHGVKSIQHILFIYTTVIALNFIYLMYIKSLFEYDYALMFIMPISAFYVPFFFLCTTVARTKPSWSLQLEAAVSIIWRTLAVVGLTTIIYFICKAAIVLQETLLGFVVKALFILIGFELEIFLPMMTAFTIMSFIYGLQRRKYF